MTGINKDTKANVDTLQSRILEIIQQRKSGESLSSFEGADLLSILITADLFKDDPKAIMDECLTFIFAGSQTTASTTANVIMQAEYHPLVKTKIRQEFDKVIRMPYQASH